MVEIMVLIIKVFAGNLSDKCVEYGDGYLELVEKVQNFVQILERLYQLGCVVVESIPIPAS